MTRCVHVRHGAIGWRQKGALGQSRLTSRLVLYTNITCFSLLSVNRKNGEIDGPFLSFPLGRILILPLAICFSPRLLCILPDLRLSSRQECKKSCPVVKMGKLCIEVGPTDKKAFLSEELCIGCGICVKKWVPIFCLSPPSACQTRGTRSKAGAE